MGLTKPYNYGGRTSDEGVLVITVIYLSFHMYYFKIIFLNSYLNLNKL